MMPSELRITQLSAMALDVPLISPFTIATSSVESVNNVAFRLQLKCGVEGWGEASILPPMTFETQRMAISAVDSARELLVGRNAGHWREISNQMMRCFPEYASFRAGIEMAMFDALCKCWKIPLYVFFGGTQSSLKTDITIPICPVDEAKKLVERYRAQGFEDIKVKIGKDLPADIERIQAIHSAHPACRLILDANTGFSADETLLLLAALRNAGIEPALLEQPVKKDDWQGLRTVSRQAGIPVAADESCCSAADAIRIAAQNLAQVINIKLVKCGVVEAMDIAAIARGAGLNLMIGGMVESRIAMGFSAHFAAGMGGFQWIDLDTPMLLRTDPIKGGYRAKGPFYDLDTGSYGHGGVFQTNSSKG